MNSEHVADIVAYLAINDKIFHEDIARLGQVMGSAASAAVLPIYHIHPKIKEDT